MSRTKAASVATHVRVGDPAFAIPLLLGILAWVGVFLRDERVRKLIPLRRVALVRGNDGT